tara:strand:- start:841 stop:1008 length:168 start_codon:yes stop_codon:yes gene_type:complete
MENLSTQTFLKMCIILSASLEFGVCYPYGIIAAAGEAMDDIAEEFKFIDLQEYDQ